MSSKIRSELRAVIAVALGLVMFPAGAIADPTVGGQEFGSVPGARPGPATSTIPTWRDTFTDPTDGATYSVDIVGSEDPRTPGAGTTTIPVEIIPVDLSFQADGGQSFNGTDVTQAVLDSPIFKPADYSAFSDNVGVQYEDAVMRSQFNQVGASTFHLALQPTVLPALRVSVPAAKGQIVTRPNGQPAGCVEFDFLRTEIWNAIGSLHISPTTLPIFMLNSTWGGVMSRDKVCNRQLLGFHGAGAVDVSPRSETVGQTYIEASFDPTELIESIKNIVILGHEVSEWADDPYGLNSVHPFSVPALGFCGSLLETGDPVIRYTVSLPGNTYFQNLPGNDGTWQVQDEVFLPWFARESPNVTSEPEASSGFGRYTFFGDANPNPAFHQPAAACS